MHRLNGPHRTQAPHVFFSKAGQAGKMLVPLLGVLAMLAMGVAAVAIVLRIQERDRLQTKERELQLALTENDDLKSRLDEAQRGKARVEEEVSNVRKELTQAQEELVKAAKAQETLARDVEDRQQEIARLSQELQQTKSQSAEMTNQLSVLQSERDTVKQRLADLEKAKSELEAKVMELSDRPTVELDKVLVTSPAAGMPARGSSATAGVVMPVSTGAAPRTSDGQVVVINREYDFIVMSLGRNQGLSVGQEFQVVRGSEVLGRVKVEKVYDELSAAALLPESKKNTIREGDLVRAL